MDTALATVQRGEITEGESVESLAGKWIEVLDVSKTTVQDYTRAIRQFVRWLAEQNISFPTRKDVIAYRDMLKETKKPSTVQLYITAVRLFSEFLSEEFHAEDFAVHIKGAKLDHSHKKDCFTREQVKALLSADMSPRNRAMLAVMVCSGLRCIEVVRADVGDLTVFRGHSVIMVQRKGRDEKKPVKISFAVEQLIRKYLATRENLSEDAPLFAAESNRNIDGRLTTRSLSRIIKGIFKSAGYDSPRLTAHSTRHTAITLALKAGKSLEEVAQFAGHSSIATTLIYAHDIAEADNSCADAVSDAIFA